MHRARPSLAQQSGHDLPAAKGHPPDAIKQQTNPMKTMEKLRRNTSMEMGTASASGAAKSARICLEW
jgi:hypothetical protein